MNKYLILTFIFFLLLLLYRLSIPPNSNLSTKSINQPTLKDSTVDSLDFEELIPVSTLNDSLNFLVEKPIQSALWDTLTDITYKTRGEYGYIPEFRPKHKILNQQTIIIQGYMYPLDESNLQKFFMLSRNPVSSCFFCGGAGPETIIEVNSPKGINMSNKLIKIKGILKLNTQEPERLFYILNGAELMKSK